MQKHVSRNRAHGFGFSAYRGKYAAKRPNPVVRTLCMVLACVIAMSLLVSGIAYQGAYAATAASGQCGADMWWEFEGSTGILTIKGQGAMWDFENPEEAPWAGFSGSIRRIVFLSGITVIGKNAFVGCSVKTVAFPDTLTVIRENAFQNCGKLVEVDASQTQLVSVEARAFSGCRGLRMEAVSMPESVSFVDETAFDKGPAEQQTAAPVVQPTEPVVEPTEPVEEPTAPAEEPTAPVEEPTEPAEEPTEPVEEPTEPVEEPTEPAEEPAKKPYKTREYDADGNLVKENCYNADGKLVGESYYDTDGKLLLSYQYDATTGATISGYDFYSDNYMGVTHTYESEYDEAGRLISVTFGYGIGDEMNYLVNEYKYDETGKVTEWSYDAADGNRVYVKYEYDVRGNLVEQRFYAPDDTTSMNTNPDGSFRIDKYEREYDEAGNLIRYVEKQCYAGEDCKPVQKSEYLYDEAGHLVETVISKPESNQSASYKYEFDDAGRQTGYNRYDIDGNLTGYGVIEFDAASAEELMKPTEETMEPTEETTEATEEITEATEETTEATEEVTESAEETTEATEEVTESAEETTESTEETTESTEETAEPTEETTEPTEETTEHTRETTETTEETTETTEEAA